MIERNQASPQVNNLIVERWSPRSFDGSAIPQQDLDVIFEAAGWSPSAFNIQPWTFLYAHRGDENWDRFLSLLIEFNQSWAKDASVLTFVVSNKMQGRGDEKSPNHSHSFDTGAAWILASLQATAMGYHSHAMSGLQFDKACEELKIPADHRLEAAFVIGRKAAKDQLPEALQEKEAASGRKSVAEIAIAGNFQ